MSYDYEMELIGSIDRKEIFDNIELDIMSEIDRLPINGGFHIVEDLEEYCKENF